MKTPYLSAKTRYKSKLVLMWIFIAFMIGCICSCTKTPTETATDAALHQANAIEQQVKKECPQAKIDEPMKALKATIESQLANCESQMGQLKEKNNTLWAVLIGLICVIIAFNWAKIKTKVFK